MIRFFGINWSQKQLFADVRQNSCSEKFRNIHRKTAVLESLYNKVAGPKTCSFIKRCCSKGVFQEQ